jgi:glycosyltransferase involved in cell wall biosynthesis
MVVTIMDLVPMQQFDSRWWKFMRRAKARRRSQRTVELASRILTISDFTAREVTRILGVARSRMRVTLLAADDFEATPLTKSETLSKLGIDGPFFLAVGAQEARKNLEVLFRAMQRVHASGANAPLVLCGPGGKLQDLAKRHQADWIRFAGFVSDAELATLYRDTTALVFPSKYEGFGLPVLEAMAAGAPVICSSASSLPEVGGDAVLYFEPTNESMLAEMMLRLLREPGLREKLAGGNVDQVSKFSWSKCAEETLMGFREALDTSRS